MPAGTAPAWPGNGCPAVVLLHEGVADRRGWAEVAVLLAPELAVVAYDRRGYGQTPVSAEPFSHLDDLLAVLGHASAGPVWLAGAPAGGGLALDAALVASRRVAGLVVMGTAVSGAPEPGLDAGTRRFDSLLEQAYAARDVGRPATRRTSCSLGSGNDRATMSRNRSDRPRRDCEARRRSADRTASAATSTSTSTG